MNTAARQELANGRKEPVNAKALTGHKTGLPSYLHGWRFLTVLKSDDPEALAFKASAAAEGPMIVFNPDFVSHEELEAPDKAILWLCAALSHISYVVLSECLYTGEEIGRFSGTKWDQFRTAACQHAAMEWTDIVKAAKREGLDFMSEHVAACLFVESGLQDRLLSRIAGTTSLKIA